MFERLLNRMINPRVITVLILVIVSLFLFADKPLSEYLAGINLRLHFGILKTLTQLGLGAIYLTFFFISALFFRYWRIHPVWEARMWFLWLCVLGTGLICGVLKVSLGRARPDMWLYKHLYGFYGFQTKAAFWSFPSGHATTIMAVGFGLSIVFPKYFYACILTAFLIALSRVLLVHHYLSDVLTATYLALIEIGALLWLLKRKSWLAPAWKNAI